MTSKSDQIIFESSSDIFSHTWRRFVVTPFEIFSSVISLLLFVSFLILCIPIGYGQTLTSKKSSHEIWNGLIRKIIRWYFYAAGIRLEIEGYHHLEKLGQPLVFAANHPSYLDPLVLRIALTDYQGCSVSAPLQTFPWPVSFWFKKVDALEVARSSDEQKRYPKLPHGDQVVKEAAQRLKHGYSILIFPEGHLERIRHTQSFRTGAVRMALTAGRPLVPVTIHNSGWIFSPKHLLLRSGTIRVVFRPAMSVPEEKGIVADHSMVNLLTNQLLCRIAQDLPASYYTPGMVLACKEILSLHPVTRRAASTNHPRKPN